MYLDIKKCYSLGSSWSTGWNSKFLNLQNIEGIRISTDSESFTSQDRKVSLSFDLKLISKMVCQVEGCDLWSLSFCISEFQNEIQHFKTQGLLEHRIQVH